VSGEARLVVATSSASYEVVIADGLLGQAGEYVRKVSDGARCALVTDDNVYGMFGATVSTSLRDAGIEAVEIVVPHGEPSKRWDRAGEVLEQMAAARLERTDLVVALGGGVIGDLAGLCAAVYLRGVGYVQLPTTLLSQVDSSVGGKTGVDLRAGKNLAGAFKQPLLVLADTSALGTLPDEEWRSGLAEVAKAAMLTGSDQVEWMIRNAGALAHREPEAVREAVLAAVRHKIGVVSADEHETGLRESLNYGHTLGHAIERVAGYGVVPHGLAVAEGMRFAARLAVSVLGASAEVASVQDDLLNGLGISQPPYPRDAEALLDAMHADKKARGGTVRFALVPEPGRYVAAAVDDDVLLAEVRAWVEQSDERG
jgi:3-dehydroquinate synthase